MNLGLQCSKQIVVTYLNPMSDLHQIVDLRAPLDDRCPHGSSIDAAVGANLYIVFYNHHYSSYSYDFYEY